MGDKGLVTGMEPMIFGGVRIWTSGCNEEDYFEFLR